MTDVSPMRWGGWGYRGSIKMFGRGAVIQRAGPGIQIDLTEALRRSGEVDLVNLRLRLNFGLLVIRRRFFGLYGILEFSNN